MLARWGPPTRSVKSGALENHTWVTEDRTPRGGSGVFGGVGVGSGGGHRGVGVGVGGAIFGASGEPVRCERTLIFRDGRVVDEDWTGEPEFCKRFVKR